MIAFLYVAGCPLSLPSIHSVVFTLPLQMFNWHKGMGLIYPSRGGVRKLQTFSPYDHLLQILFLFLTKSGPQKPEHCGVQNLLCRFPEAF